MPGENAREPTHTLYRRSFPIAIFDPLNDDICNHLSHSFAGHLYRQDGYHSECSMRKSTPYHSRRLKLTQGNQFGKKKTATGMLLTLFHRTKSIFVR
jgi:hypothetical protein